MHRLKDLFKMVPEGSWSKDGENLVDPEGNRIEIVTPGLTGVKRRLYCDLLYALINRTQYVLFDLDMRERQVAALFKELNHQKERTKTAFIQGVEAAGDIISNIEVGTPTARDALNEAIEKLDDLCSSKRSLGRNESIPSNTSTSSV